MNPEQVNQVANLFIDQLHRLEEGDPSGVDEMVRLFADDAQLSNPLIEHDTSSRSGREGIAHFWQEYKSSFRDIHSEFTDVTVGPHSAGLFWESSGTDVSGKPLQYKGVSQLLLNEAGKIRSFTGYFDTAALRQRQHQNESQS
jgi:ketosteroid isomerase-like protein